MQIKTFVIPVYDNEIETNSLNQFLKHHKILEVENIFFQQGQMAAWSILVKYTDQKSVENEQYSKRKDYKNELEPAIFERFTTLRTIRKTIAQENAVPVYVVFTDAELEALAKLPEINETTMITIKGIGEKKIEKYGKRVIQLWHEKQANSETEG